ncbi:MAG: hypothetical protein SCK29_09965 [Bacillota bacterium]|nr:hypothetical protein [Bacillota bacterium]MDW7684426.1 hypothetical protein [Bacillota bacterium]
MLVVLAMALMVTFMFSCDYILDGEKVFHVKPVEREACQARPFTTIQALVMNK